MNAVTTSACVIIPARYASTRFPGKPLVRLLGKPMILWVAELSAKAVGQEHVFIATDDIHIAKVVKEAGYSVLMTSSEANTGTDRIAEAAAQIDYDIYVNVQGDEPLVSPGDITACIKLKCKNPNFVINGFCFMSEDEDPRSVNIPKVITNESGMMVYMSRSPLPSAKVPDNFPKRYMKQVCIYGFSRDELLAYSEFGRKSVLENHEDIEILRFLDLDRPVLMFECQPGSLAVDVPSDVSLVEESLSLLESAI